jgi:hypothetical protein
MNKTNTVKLEWAGDSRLKINDINFYLSCDTKELQEAKSSSDTFILGKPKQMVEKSFLLAEEHSVKKIFEMGILQGGSVALYDQIFSPEKIVAIEYVEKPIETLASYITNHCKSEVVKPFYGINQADSNAMQSILSAEFPDNDIDLIIDDASHLYNETKAAFNISFPYLKSGGLYVIEDWAWAHWSGDFWQNNKLSYLNYKRAMSNLLIELFMLCASRPDIIKNISIEPSAITITKGEAILPNNQFNIGNHYLMRGKTWGFWLKHKGKIYGSWI